VLNSYEARDIRVEYDTKSMKSAQKIVVFQQNGSGERKIAGIRQYAQGAIEVEVISIDEMLPPVIDDAGAYLPDRIDADLVLDFLKHEDLSHDLVAICHKQGTPVISSGKKIPSKWVLTPVT
jgi:hypothetical protein